VPLKPQKLRPLRDIENKRSLANDLVPIADDIRQLATDFGCRPYRVRLVWVRWQRASDPSGLVQLPEVDIDEATVGAGTPVVLFELEILPTPKISTMNGVGKQALSTGRTEDGTITIDRISRSYSEDVLRGRLPLLMDPERPEQLKKGIDFFWELQEDRPHHFAQVGAGGPLITDDYAQRRRFHLVDVPHLNAGAAHWTATLLRADGERGRDGQTGEMLP
jgi:hypothetical protein